MSGFGPPLPRSFFARPSTVVAPELLGRVVVRDLPDGTRLVVRIVETEAYEEDDPASHSYRGQTDRNRVMFGPAGRLYVYQMHRSFCMNVATGRDGEGSAVLFRAAEPIAGLGEMWRLRGVDALRIPKVGKLVMLCSGPGKLCQALGVSRDDDGLDLVRGSSIRMFEGEAVPGDRIAVTTRIGISVAVERPWRFLVRDDPFVSRGGSPPE